MNASEQSLKAELGTALLSTLSSDDQHEVDRLNDEIQELTAKNRHALEERVKVCSHNKNDGEENSIFVECCILWDVKMLPSLSSAN